GKMKIEYSYINVVDHLQFIINIFKPKAANKNLRMELNIDPQLPAEIFIDKQRLKQILFNLVGNAVKFTEEGYVKLSARLAENKNDGLDIIFAVEDSGIGIPSDAQDIIFDSFRQKEGHDTREYGGTGLGLTITKKLVNMMRGEISVESEPEKGSVFTVLFKDVEYKQIIKEEEQSSNPSELFFDRARTMVVDDNDLNRDMLSEILKNEGLEVVTAKNGKEAIQIVKNEQLDLIFMDIKMPKMNGIDATHEIKNYQNGSPLPVIAFTAKNDQEFDRQKLDQVFDEFLRKPFPKKALMEILKKYLAYELR
ncbi:MAG TPA: response regulator, partial [bacterium]|nr:response regulator [bacterium]